MNKIILRSFIIFVFILCAGMLFASETGEIEGKVVDEKGNTLPGVSISAESPKLQGIRSTSTDENGFFKFPLLPIGKYSLTFELSGFENVTYTGYNVRLGFTLSIEIVLNIETLTEEIIVTAETPLIDKKNSDNSYRMNSEHLAYTPTQSRTIEEVVAYTPGVTGVRSSSMFGTGAGLPSFRGAGEETNNWLVDGLSQRGVICNDPGVAINLDAWEEIQIISDGFAPDLGQSLGGIINIVTKTGGNDFHGELGTLIRDWHLRADRKEQLSVVTEPDTSIHQYFGNIGGPIIKDKLWFFLSDNYHRTVDNSEAGSIGWLNFPAGEKKYNTNNVFGKLTFSPHVNHTLSMSGTLDAFINQKGGNGLVETYTKETYTDYSYRINYRGIVSQNLIIEAAFGQYDQDYNMKPLEENYGPARYFWQDIAQYTNNADGDFIEIQKRTDFTARFTQYIDAKGFGRHEIGFGFNYFSNSSDKTYKGTGLNYDLWPGNGFDNGVSIDWVSPGIPLSLNEVGPYGVKNTTEGVGFYIKDAFTIDRFSIMLGLRTETQKIFNDIGAEIWHWGLGDFLSPRASIVVDLLADGKNILKFSFGQFKDTISTSSLLFYNTTVGYQFRRYNWIGEANPSISQLAESSNWEFSYEQSSENTPMAVDAGLKPNKTTKFLLEFDRQLSSNWVAKLRGVYSYSKNLIEDIGLYDPVYTVYFYLTNFEFKKRDYKALEFEINGRIADKFMLNASYTWSEAKGTNPGQTEYGSWSGQLNGPIDAGPFGDYALIPESDPWKAEIDAIFGGLGGRGIGDQGWYGFLPYSVDHQVKILGTYFAPFGIVISGIVEYLSGYHWQKKGYQGYGDFFTFPEGRGVRTTPGHMYIDISVEKDLRISDRLAIGLRLNVYNLLNSQKPVSYVMADTSLFGEVWGRQQPRWIQFQLRLKF